MELDPRSLIFAGLMDTALLGAISLISLLIAADNALYAAKGTGRNRIVAAGNEVPTDPG